MKKTFFAVLLFLIAIPLSAHVVVKPSEVGIGAFQTFSIGVPVEKDIPTIGIKLLIPEGLDYVSPNVKSGWKINTKKSGTGETSKVTEIDWTGGVIPSGQRDDFVFSAKVPSTATSLVWKAYQTYQDGTVVSWDISSSEQPKKSDGSPDFSKSGPFSETKIIDDLSTKKSSSSTPLVISIVALVFSIISLGKSRRSKTNVI